nr:MAG TPA: hypothetical protein [Caudoviricetes sp.]
MLWDYGSKEQLFSLRLSGGLYISSFLFLEERLEKKYKKKFLLSSFFFSLRAMKLYFKEEMIVCTKF